jgi:CHAT domain-containing protein
MDSCISLAVKLKTGYPYAMKYINEEIQYFFDRGDYYNCLNYTTIGEDIVRKSGDFPEDVFYYLIWKINALNFLDRSAEAGRLADKSIRECLRTGNKTYLGSLLSLKASISAEKPDSSDAVSYTFRSLSYNRKAKNYAACAASLINLGYKLYFTKFHQYDKALHYYKEALKYAGDNNSMHILILDNMANAYLRKGNFSMAFYFFQQAFNKLKAGSDENILLVHAEASLTNTNSEYLINLVLDYAEARLSYYKQTKNLQDIRRAIHIYKVADRFMDKVRMTQTEPASRLFWRGATGRLYEQAIGSCFLSGDTENAFYFFEKSKAVLLNDQLREQQAGGPDILQIARVKKRILQLESANDGPDPSSQQYSDLQRAIFIKKQELNRAEQLIKDRNPWYYQSLIDTNFISLKQTQEKLLGTSRAQAILEFFGGDSAVYLLTILPDTSYTSTIGKDAFETAVGEFTTRLSSPAAINRDFSGYVKSAARLYQLLFSDIPLPAGRVIISPDGKYFPFEALVINPSLANPVYFLKDHPVSYTYSVRYLMNEPGKNESIPSRDFLGIAPVRYSPPFHLAALPESDISVKRIGNYFTNPQMLLAGRATKDNFMEQFPRYRIIQLYTHASDSSSRGEPVIYFADSALYLSELIPENTPATRLIILSACETGNGKLYKREGVYSFNRGFAGAGIPSSIINLWSVDNKSSYRLTELFYKYVETGLPLDLALQKAKLEFLESASGENKLPYYWAAFIITGKTDPIGFKKNNTGLIILIAGVSVLALLALRYSSIRVASGRSNDKRCSNRVA